MSADHEPGQAPLPHVRRSQQARRRATRDAILEAAVALFASHGVTGTSVDDIAVRAGTAKGSIYYNFGSKEALVSELMAEQARQLGELLATAAAPPGQEGIVAILDTLLAEIAEHPAVAQVMATEVFRTDRSWIEVVQRWRSVITEPLEAKLAEVHGGSHTQNSLQASALVGATLTIGLDWLVRHPETPRSEVLAALCGLSGVLPDEPPTA